MSILVYLQSYLNVEFVSLSRTFWKVVENLVAMWFAIQLKDGGIWNNQRHD